MAPPNFTLDAPPMPSMPPEPLPSQPRWRKRLRAACLLSLAALGPGFLCAMGPDIGGLWASGLRWGVGPVVTAVICISGWLLTTPDPTNSTWLRASRLVIRASLVTTVLDWLLGLAIVEGLFPLGDGRVTIGTLRLLSAFFGLIGGVAAFGYCARLADRLGDRVLRVNFNVLKWIVGILLAVMAIAMIASFPEAAQSYATQGGPSPGRDPEARRLGHKIAWFCLSASSSAWWAWLMYRLFRRLRLPDSTGRSRTESQRQ